MGSGSAVVAFTTYSRLQRAGVIIAMPHWLDSVVCKFAFPAPEPSYDADRPLRLYDIDGKFYRIKPQHPWQPTFADFDAELLWVQHVPVIAFPKSDASQVIVFAHANADDV